MTKTALLFSGQGSQYKGMFADYIESTPSAKEKISIANEILGYDIGEIMTDLESNKITETRYTQPAIYIHSTLAFDLAKDKLEYSALAGHSIGEFSALYAAGVYSWEDGLRLVSKRGELMFNSGETKPGTMFAVVGAADNIVIETAEKLTHDGKGNVVVAANFNSPGQVVVSGDRDYLRENSDAFKKAGAKLVKELNVSGAFHSPLLADAQKNLEGHILKANFKDASLPVYQNIDAEPHTSAALLKENLIKQLTGSVKWSQTLQNMESQEIKTYIEIGPGKVLQGLVKRTISADSISGVDKYQDILTLNG